MKLREINLDEYGSMRVILRPLKFKHFMEMFKKAHAHAFAVERNIMGLGERGYLTKVQPLLALEAQN